MSLFVVGKKATLHKRRKALFINTSVPSPNRPRLGLRRGAVQLARAPYELMSPEWSIRSMDSISFNSNDTFEHTDNRQPNFTLYNYNPDFINN